VNAAFQVVGVAAILIGFAGTWLAPHHRTGWLIGLTSAWLWIPALANGQQWAGVANCFISMGICARNYLTSRQTRPAIHSTQERSRP
jgi:hypothetical protein